MMNLDQLRQLAEDARDGFQELETPVAIIYRNSSKPFLKIYLDAGYDNVVVERRVLFERVGRNECELYLGALRALREQVEKIHTKEDNSIQEATREIERARERCRVRNNHLRAADEEMQSVRKKLEADAIEYDEDK